MGVRFPSVQTNTFIGPLPASAAETIICTTPGLNISLDFSIVLLVCMCQILAGTGTTSYTYRIRRGTTTAGVQVNASAWSNNVTVGANSCFGFCYFDTPGAVAAQQYSLTVQQNGATAAGTFGDCALLAFAL